MRPARRSPPGARGAGIRDVPASPPDPGGEGIRVIGGLPDALPEAEALRELWTACGGDVREAPSHQALACSWEVAAAYDRGRLVGFARLLSDGVRVAILVEAVVHPTWRTAGVTTGLLDLLLERCARAGVREVIAPSGVDDPCATRHGYRVEPVPAQPASRLARVGSG